MSAGTTRPITEAALHAYADGQLAEGRRLQLEAYLSTHPEVRRPVEIGADQQAQLVAWLSKRLGAK